MQHSVSEELKEQIVRELIEPCYYSDITHVIHDKKCWKLTGSIFETISKILVSGGAIMSFASGYYLYPTMSFVSGAVSTISVAFLQFSSYCYKEQKRNAMELNELLTKLHIDKVPVFSYDPQGGSTFAREISPPKYRHPTRSYSYRSPQTAHFAQWHNNEPLTPTEAVRISPVSQENKINENVVEMTAINVIPEINSDTNITINGVIEV
jgi:hypothetical protein